MFSLIYKSYNLVLILNNDMQVKLREMKPGMLSHELKEALGMPEGAPPPWLINMQVISMACMFYYSGLGPFITLNFFPRDMVLLHLTLIWRSRDWMLPFPLVLVLVIILVAGASLLLTKYIFYIHSYFYHLIFEFSFSLEGSPHPCSPFSSHRPLFLSATKQYGRPLYGDVFGVHQQEQPNYEVGLHRSSM